MKSFFFPFSFCICIGKWGGNASFDVSKSSFAQLPWNRDLTWVGGRVEDLQQEFLSDTTGTYAARYHSRISSDEGRDYRCSVSSCSSPRLFLLSTSSPFLCLHSYLPPMLTPVTNTHPSHAQPTILWAFSTYCWLVGLNLKGWIGNEKSSWPLTLATLEHRGRMVRCNLNLMLAYDHKNTLSSLLFCH